MSTYKVTEVDEDSSGYEIIIYLLLFTILLPFGVLYLIYKLIKWIYDKKNDYDYKHFEDFEQAVEDLNSLYASYIDGLVNGNEYCEKRWNIINRMRINKCSNDKIRERLISLKELNKKGIVSDSEYEDIRKRLVQMLN